MVTWLIATKDSVTGGYYANAARSIIKSSQNVNPYTALWYRRSGSSEDPWVSTCDHGAATTNGQMVYGENGASSSTYLISIVQHQGNNVFIRKCPCI